jgi:predicted amidohydrolase YtcJ
MLVAGMVQGAEPTLLQVNARIWTGDAARPWAETVAITGERITAAGASPAILKLKVVNTSVVDLGGRLVIPRFNDAHTHFLSGSLLLSQVGLTGASSIAEMQRRIAGWAKSHPDAAWITGSGWEYTPFPGGLPNKRDLDAATSGRPAFIEAYDGHTGWANSVALQKAGIREGFEYKGFGGVVLHANGEPTGALKEGAQDWCGA